MSQNKSNILTIAFHFKEYQKENQFFFQILTNVRAIRAKTMEHVKIWSTNIDVTAKRASTELTVKKVRILFVLLPMNS